MPFSALPPEIRQQILTLALLPSPPYTLPPFSTIKLSINNTTALSLATVSKQWAQDMSYVHCTWRKDHPLEGILREEWTTESAGQFKSVEGIMRRWGLFDSGHEAELDEVESDGMRLVRVLEWARNYMTHLRARGFEQKQRNRELERTIEVQRRWLREAREREERLDLRVKMLEEGMDRVGLDY